MGQQLSKVISSPSLQQLIERMKPLQVILSQNSYIKDTQRRLDRIIKDAITPTMVLIMGKEGVGKTTLINALLGRELLMSNHEQPTSVNTFIRYGEEECIKLYFLDGMVVTFDHAKIEFITVSTNYSAQIIREHIDYVEIYVHHPLLQKVTLIDTVALEVTESRVAYISDILVERIDEILWVIRNGSPATVPEMALLQQYAERGLKPGFVINKIDENQDVLQDFMQSEYEQYGELIQSMVAVSARDALTGAITKNEQLLIDSRIHELEQYIDRIIQDEQSKTKHIVARFIEWLELCRYEFEQIPTKEPYASAIQTVTQLHRKEGHEFTHEERDRALLSAYEQEYEHICHVFNSVETLYQLLQKLTSELYLRNERVEIFEDVASRYQSAVREYRKLHMEYVQAYGLLDQRYRKILGKGIEKGTLADIEANHLLSAAKEKLDEQQLKLEQHYIEIKGFEQRVLEQLYGVQNELNELASKRLKLILQQVTDLNMQRKHEVKAMTAYVTKLSEFACIEEAQQFMKEAIVPYLQSGELPLTEQQLQHAKQVIAEIIAIQLKSENLDLPNMEDTKHSVLEQEFETLYTLAPIRLTEADVVSIIPECPKPLFQE